MERNHQALKPSTKLDIDFDAGDGNLEVGTRFRMSDRPQSWGSSVWRGERHVEAKDPAFEIRKALSQRVGTSASFTDVVETLTTSSADSVESRPIRDTTPLRTP